MIQDISPEVFRNEFSRKREPEEEDRVFLFRGRNVLVRTGIERAGERGAGGTDASAQTGMPADCAACGESIRADNAQEQSATGADIAVPTVREVEAAGLDGAFLQYLFTIEETAYYLWMSREPGSAAQEPPVIPGYEYGRLSLLRHSRPRDLSFAGETAYQLYGWYRDNRFCGRCGASMRFGDKERNMVCPVCGNVSYPKIMPAVIVGVTDGDRLLMTRYRGREYRGRALIAGFCEIGETGEDTVRREVMEEAGLRVKNIRYYKSQPWGFDSDLLLGYYCEVDGDTAITMEEDELSVAEWVRRAEITETFENMSLTNEMICRFRDGAGFAHEKRDAVSE